MNILIGIGIVLILVSIIVFEVCFLKVLKTPPIKIEEKETTEDKIKQEELRKSFENLMNYDYNEALKKKE